ncbi:MAG: hypothetical protein KME47_09510 [Nodosilinea sp. WJT8-NPBG4]|jgi:hypothetical protein|nr:hypothetical protein [Nodosilinea sp. WJT8-NPBG4]
MNSTLDNVPLYFLDIDPDWKDKIDTWASNMPKSSLLGVIGLTQHLLYSPAHAIGALKKDVVRLDGCLLYSVEEDALAELNQPRSFQCALTHIQKHLVRYWIGATSNRITLRKYIAKLSGLGAFRTESEWHPGGKQPMLFHNLNFDLLLGIYERLEKAWFERGFTVHAFPKHRGFVGNLLFQAWTKVIYGVENAKPNRSGQGSTFDYVSKARHSQIASDKDERAFLEYSARVDAEPSKRSIEPPKPVLTAVYEAAKAKIDFVFTDWFYRFDFKPKNPIKVENLVTNPYSPEHSSLYCEPPMEEYDDDMRAYVESIPFN